MAVCPNFGPPLQGGSSRIRRPCGRRRDRQDVYLRTPEFAAYIADMGAHFIIWRTMAEKSLKALKPGFHPKALIPDLADNLLAHYLDNPLIDPYAVYQHLMDYWTSTMQDDCYLIAALVGNYRHTELLKRTRKLVRSATRVGLATSSRNISLFLVFSRKSKSHRSACH